MTRARTAATLALLVLFTGTAWAQVWRGPAALAVEVKGKQRGSVDNALVVLRYQLVEPAAGPRPVRTDSAGRAVIADLADGIWEVEVSHEEFLSFVALVVVEEGRKPIVQASFLQASGSSLTPIRVRFADGRGKTPSAPVPLPPEAAERLAQRQPPPPPPPPEGRETEPAAQAPTAAEPRHELRPLPEPAQPPAAPPPPPPAARPEPDEPAAPEPAAPAAEPETEMAQEAPPPPAAPEPAAPQPAAPPEPPAAATPEPPSPQPEAPAAPRPEPPEDAAAVPQTPAAEPAPAAPPAPPEPQPAAPQPAAEVEPGPEPPIAMPEPAVAEPEPQPPAATPAAPAPPAPPAQATPPAAAPEPAAAMPEPAPQPAAVPQPGVAEAEPPPPPMPEATSPAPPAVVQPAPGRLGPTLRAYRDQSCIECRPGEWALSVEAIAGPASAACPEGLEDDGKALAELLGGAVQLELKEIAAPAADALGHLAADDAAQGAALLGDGSRSCRIVAVVLPKAGRFRGVRMEAADVSGIGDCQANQPCPVGRAGWIGQPRVSREPSANVIWGLFVNQAPDRARRARMTVYFQAPNRLWSPPRD